jgi:hypothetical protein
MKKVPLSGTDATGKDAEQKFTDALRELIRSAAAPPSDELVDVAKALPVSSKVAFALCRSGRIKATKVGRVWVARRSELERFLEAERKACAPRAKALSVDDRIAAELGLRRRAS